MARTVRSPKLDTRSARARLKPRREPYWCAIAPGRHLGYRRIGVQGGNWIAKLRCRGAGRWTKALGPADDALDARADVLTFSDAQERARQWFAEQERKTTGEPSAPITIAEVVKDYLAWTKKHRRPSTAREWTYMSNAHILPQLGKLEVAQLTTAQLRRWHEELAEQPPRVRTRLGAKQQYRELTTDPNTVRARRATANRNLTVLKAALNHAWQGGRITGSDQAWRRVKPFRGADIAQVRYLQIDECTRLLNACEPNLRQLVRGALVSGARYGELCRADVSDFNPDSASLLVRESKGGKPRHIPLDDEAAAFFASITAGRGPADPLFVREDGGRWGKSHQRRPLFEACRTARIEPAIGFHILRHTWASLRIMAGLPLMVAAQVLGHSDTRMVEKHYGHLAQSFVREAVRTTALPLAPFITAVAPLHGRR